MANLTLKLERTCRVCGATFRPKTLESWYCSAACGKSASKARSYERKAKEQLDRLLSLGADSSAYIKVREASQLYNVSMRTLYRLIKSGKLPAVQISPRNIRVSRVELEKIVSKRPDEELPKKPKLYNMEPEACYTIGEIQKKYKINDRSVWEHIRKYSIPTRQIGNYVYAPKEDIDKLYTT